MPSFYLNNSQDQKKVNSNQSQVFQGISTSEKTEKQVSGNKSIFEKAA